MRKQPLLLVAFCHAAGIILGSALDGLVGWKWLLLVTGMAALAYLKIRESRPLLLGLAFALAGWSHYALQTDLVSPHDLRRLLGTEPVYATVVGSLESSPQTRIYQRGDREQVRNRALVSLRGLRREGEGMKPAQGRVLVRTAGELPVSFFLGQQVEVAGVLQPPARPWADGLFDYRSHLERQGVFYQLYVSSTNDWRLGPGAGNRSRPWSNTFAEWARGVLARGLPEEDAPLRLLWAMSLGWRTALTEEVAEPFMQSGTLHIFAISGFHVTLVSWTLMGLLRMVRLPKPFCGLMVIPALWFYAAVTGWPPSAVRASVMMSILILGWSLNRPGDLLNSLAAAALIILLWDPRQLFQIGFQLSFFVVLSLVLWQPVLGSLSGKLLKPDPFLPDSLRSRWQRRWRALLRYLAAGLTTSLAAWLGSLPLVASYFHVFNPIGILANLVILPLGTLALEGCVASLLVGWWWAWPSELFNHSAWFWMSGMIRVSEWAAAVPGAWCYVPSPPAAAVLLYYGLMISLLAGGWQRRTSRRVILWIAAFLLCGLGYQYYQHRNQFSLTILPVQGGDAGLLTGPGCGGGILIDGGNPGGAESVTIPYLKVRGVNHLSRLCLTHGDVRHVGGAKLIADRFAPGQVHASTLSFRSPAYRQVSEQFTAAGCWQTVHPGEVLGPWRVLYPSGRDTFPKADDKPLVFLGRFYGVRVLWVSDLSSTGQNALLNRFPDLRADVVISGLPTDSEPCSNGFLNGVQPGIVIITDADYPAGERARPRLKERLARQPVQVIYTRVSGAVTLTVWRDGFRLDQTRTAEKSLLGDVPTSFSASGNPGWSFSP